MKSTDPRCSGGEICSPHKGPLTRVTITGDCLFRPALEWYCAAAIEEDRRRGFTVTPVATSHEFPPIPDRSHDWRAHRPDRDESGPYGWGATEIDAVLNLIEQELEAE